MGKTLKAAEKQVGKTTKAVAKTAQRTKMIEAKVPCPHCGGPATLAVQYYPPKGPSISARGCGKCGVVYQPRDGTVLVRGVKAL